MPSFKNPTYQDRVSQAADARQKALEQLRQRPPRDAQLVADRLAAAQKRDAAKAERAAAKKLAEADAAAAEAAEAAANAPPSEADRKAARDARYAARKNRRRG